MSLVLSVLTRSKQKPGDTPQEAINDQNDTKEEHQHTINQQQQSY